MTEKDKRPFYALYEAEKEEYQKVNDKFMTKLEKEGKTELFIAKGKVTRGEATIKKLKREVKKLEEEMGKPKNPTRPYCMFLADEGKGKKGLSAPALMRNAQKKWHALPNEQKMIYMDRFKALKVEHTSRMDAWRKQHVNTDKMTELEEAMGKLKIVKRKNKSIHAESAN